MNRRLLNLALAVVVAVAGVSLWLSHGSWPGLGDGEGHGGTVPEASPAAAVAEQTVPVAVHLRVLNATEVKGLAGEIALLLPGLGGCVVEGVGNAPRWPGSRSVLINRRLAAGQAEALARVLGDLPVIPEWDERTSEDAVLVLGEDHERVRQALAGTPAGR